MGLSTLTDDIIGIAKANPIATAIGASGVAVGSVLGVAAIVRKSKPRKNKRSKSKRSRKRNRKGRKLKFGSKAYRKKYLNGRRKQKRPRTAGKGKDRSTKRIRYTKNNQPYVILASGKARFIKKSSAKRSRKQKGGRY